LMNVSQVNEAVADAALLRSSHAKLNYQIDNVDKSVSLRENPAYINSS